jgi:hypothetical protein
MKKRKTWRTWLGVILVAIPTLILITAILITIWLIPEMQIMALSVLLFSMFFGGAYLLNWRDF